MNKSSKKYVKYLDLDENNEPVSRRIKVSNPEIFTQMEVEVLKMFEKLTENIGQEVVVDGVLYNNIPLNYTSTLNAVNGFKSITVGENTLPLNSDICTITQITAFETKEVLYYNPLNNLDRAGRGR